MDTSVWVDHLRSPEAELQSQLRTGQVLTHPMIIGELACGIIPTKKRVPVLLGYASHNWTMIGSFRKLKSTG